MAAEDQKIVIMADDDPEDCLLATEAFKASGANASFCCVDDGFELMDYLSKGRRSGENGLPDLILMDLNMPRKDGRKALIEIKSDPGLKHIPIVILTTSKEEKDIAFGTKAGAESLITKPETFREWVEIMKSLAESWLVK